MNNITGTLPGSWSNLTQASTITTDSLSAALLAIVKHCHHLTLHAQSSHNGILHDKLKHEFNAAASIELEQEPSDGDFARELEQPHQLALLVCSSGFDVVVHVLLVSRVSRNHFVGWVQHV